MVRKLLIFFTFFYIIFPYTLSDSVDKSHTSPEITLSYTYYSNMEVTVSIPSDKLISPPPDEIDDGSTITVCPNTPVRISVVGDARLGNTRTDVYTNLDSVSGECSSYSGSGPVGANSYSSFRACMKVYYSTSSSTFDYGTIQSKGKPEIIIAGTSYNSRTASKTITISSNRYVDMSYKLKSVWIKALYPEDGSVRNKLFYMGDSPTLTSRLSFVVAESGTTSAYISPTTVASTVSPTTFVFTIYNTGSQPLQLSSVSSTNPDVEVTTSSIGTVIPAGSSESVSISVTVTSTSPLTSTITFLLTPTTSSACGSSSDITLQVTFRYEPTSNLADLVPRYVIDFSSYPDVYLKVKGKNQGTLDAENVYLKVENLTTYPGFFTLNLGDIAANGESPTLDLKYDCSDESAIYRVHLTIDPDNNIDELSEDNNEVETTIYCSLQCEFNPTSLIFDDNSTKTATLTCDGANCEDVTWDPLTKFSISFTNPTFSITPTDAGTFAETLKVRAQKDGQIYNCDLPLSSNIEEGMSECRKRI